MRSLCFLTVLITVTIASPVSDSVEANKRIIDGILGGESGLLDGLLGGDGGFIGGLLVGEGGLLGGVIEEVTDLVTGVLDTFLKLVASLTEGLKGKTSQPEIYAEFKKYPLEKLCPVCSSLSNVQHVQACKQYCSEQNRTSTKRQQSKYN